MARKLGIGESSEAAGTGRIHLHACVNGQPHCIDVVNEAFRGLALPAGRHVIEMSYAPRTLFAARILTAFGLLIAFVLFAARPRIDPWLRKVLVPVPPASSIAKV